jgi:hypothetical protein
LLGHERLADAPWRGARVFKSSFIRSCSVDAAIGLLPAPSGVDISTVRAARTAGRAAKTKLEANRERTVARKSKIIVGDSDSTLRSRFHFDLFFEPRWATDEFVGVDAPEAAH